MFTRAEVRRILLQQIVVTAACIFALGVASLLVSAPPLMRGSLRYALPGWFP